MKKESTPLKINKETLETLRNQHPDESINEIIGWHIFELTYAKRKAKELKIPLSLLKEANIFISSVSGILGVKIKSLTEVFKNEIEDGSFDEAMKIFEEDI